MRELFAIVPPGLEAVAASEAERLGALVVAIEPGGLALRGDLPTLFRLQLGARIPSRILLRLARSPLPAFRQLLKTLDFSAFLTSEAAFSVDVSGGGSRPSELSRPLTEALLRGGWRKAAPGEEAQTFYLRLSGGELTLSLDASGAHLHQRGYRQETGVAPLRENLAAGILALAGYNPLLPLLDPMCGSGTFLIEAALTGLGRPPGGARRFALEAWPCLPADTAAAEREAFAAKERKELPAPVVGSDRNAGALGVARRNAERAGVLEHLKLERRDALEIEPPGPAGLLVTNPPYGKRVGEVRELAEFHRLFGTVLRERFVGWTVAVFVSDPAFEAALALPAEASHPLRNGGISCRLVVARL